MLEGSANKVSFIVVFVSALCWVVYVAGFAMRYAEMYDSNSKATNPMLSPHYFSHWCFLVSSVFFYLMTFLHLLCGSVCTAMVVLILLPVALVTAGGVLDKDGTFIYQYYHDGLVVDYMDYAAIEFAGAIGAIFFYWLSLVLWVCHSYGNKAKQSRNRVEYENINY